MRFLSSVALICVLAVAGCGSKKQMTAKQRAHQQWYSARASVQVSLATDQLKSGNLDKARKTVDEALALDANNATAHVLSAKIAIEQGKLELAENELTIARHLNPRDAEPEYLTGVIYQRWQKPEVAYQHYQAAAEKAPTELAYLLAGAEMLVLLGQEDLALSQLQERAIYFEHAPAIRDAVGQLLMAKGDCARAADYFRQASILASEDPTIKEHLAVALFRTNQHREAADVLKRLTAKEPHAQRADLLAMLGECQLELGQSREARENFDAASRIDPGSPQVWLGLAKAALQLEDDRRSELSIRKALSMDPRQPEAHLLLGYLRLRQRKLNEALSAFQKANALQPGDTVSLCMIGLVLERMGHADQAMDHYGRALQIEPKDELAMKLMAGIDPAE